MKTVHTMIICCLFGGLLPSAAVADHGPNKVITVVQTGAIKVHNSTDLPYHISLDQQMVGMIHPGETVKLANTPVGIRQVTARFVGKINIPDQSFTVEVFPTRGAEVHLRTPFGVLRVHNPNPFPMTLLVNGQRHRDVRGGTTVVLNELAPGRYHLVLDGPHGASVANTVRIRHGEVESWHAPVVAATIQIHNDSYQMMKVRINGRSAGRIAAGGILNLDGLAPGRQVVEVRGHGGLRMVRTFDVHPTQVAVWSIDAPQKHHPHVVKMKNKMKKKHQPSVIVVAKH